MTIKSDLSSEKSIPVFGRYIVSRILGEGAMGRVYLAHDPVLERKIALKVITVDRRLSSKIQAEYRRRFTIEAKASAKLNHQSIVAVYDAGNQDGIPWIAFQYVDGQSLDIHLQQKKLIALPMICRIACDIAGALQHAHSQKIYHRDIKPANIIIDKTSHIAKLTDFGIAKAPGLELTQEGQTLGTPGYMSPEQIKGLELDARTDLFSLGVIVYKMISRKHPFLRDTLAKTVYATLGGEYTPLTKINPSLPAAVDIFMADCLAVDKNERIQSAEVFMRQLKSVLLKKPRTRIKLIERPVKTSDSMNLKKNFIILDSWIKTVRQSGVTAIKTVNWDKLFFDIRKGIGKGQLRATNILKLLGTQVCKWLKKLYIGLHTGWIWCNTHKRSASILSVISIHLITLCWFIFFVNTHETNISKIPDNPPEKKELISKVNLFSFRPPKIVKEGREYLKKNEYQEAQFIVGELKKNKNQTAYGFILSGEMLIKKERYAEAQKEFSQVFNQPRGKTIIKPELTSVLSLIGEKMARQQAPSILIDLIAKTLKAADHELVKEWVTSQQYWRRWNAVTLMETASLDIDMVSVYMLDLRYAGSSRTRVRAARELGKLGDKRAIPALEEARNRGFRDPFVAGAAKRILESEFLLDE